MKFPSPDRADLELTDGSIRIRPLLSDDADGLFEAARESIAEVHPFLPWCHPDYTSAEAKAFCDGRATDWESGESFSFAVFDVATGRFVGGCGLNHLNPEYRLANLGYWVRTSATGRVVCTRSVRLLSGWAFEALDLVRLEIVTQLDNIASQRVAEKAGAVREGVLRNRLVIREEPHDAVMFSLLPGDLTG